MRCENYSILEGFEYEFECCDCCEDAYVQNTKGVRKTGRRYRRRMDAIKKAEELKNIKLGKGHSWASYGYVDGECVRVGNFAKHPKHSIAWKCLKRSSNKAVRRHPPETCKGNQYKRVPFKWSPPIESKHLYSRVCLQNGKCIKLVL